jgi:hypothetical protein
MKIWIVSLVKRGFISEPEIFQEEEIAVKRFEELSRDLNPTYDELEIFEKSFFPTS